MTAAILPVATRRRFSAVFGASLAVNVAAAAFLAFFLRSGSGDSLSRVANAYYVVFSRDPHLAAIGFVWGPLPSMLVLPVLPLKAIWPPLATVGFAGHLVSALFMAGTVHQMWRLLRDIGGGRATSVVFALLFGFHPLVLYSGANGSSEAPFLFFLVVASRLLISWLDHRRPTSLGGASLCLGLAYLCRYETLAPGAGVAAFVVAASWLRERQRAAVIADFLLVVTPFAFTVLLWAGISFVVTGQPFQQLTSEYGNSAQIETLGETMSVDAAAPGVTGPFRFAVEQTLRLAPALPIVAVALGAIAVTRRVRSLPPLVVLGSTLAFSWLAAASGATAGWIRYHITAVPLTVVAAVVVAAATRHALRSVTPAAAAATVAIGLVVATSFPTAVVTMADPKLDPIEHAELAPLWARFGIDAPVEVSRRYDAERDLAAFLDGLDADVGDVVIDTFLGHPVVLASRDPRQFVITNDRDFERRVADPAVFGVRYVVVPSPDGAGALDAVNRHHVGLYYGKPRFTLVEEFPAVARGAISWRVYEVEPLERRADGA